jgi:hypothetical protein
MNDPLLRLLALLDTTTRPSGFELRSRLGLSRETYDDLMTHLTRMGYLEAHDMDVACASGGCQGCEVGCQSTPDTGPRSLSITAKGRRYLERSGSG